MKVNFIFGDNVILLTSLEQFDYRFTFIMTLIYETDKYLILCENIKIVSLLTEERVAKD